MAKNWLEELKAGDEVIVDAGGYRKRLRAVAKITPKQIVLDCGERYTRDKGRRLGTPRDYACLRRVTPENRDPILRTELIAYVIQHTGELHRLQTDVLESIVQAMKQAE